MRDSHNKTLIVKLGATGDVVRTTPLLHAIEGDIHWLTTRYNSGVLPADCSKLSRVFTIEDDIAALAKLNYDHVLSLDEDPEILGLLQTLNYKRLSGVFMEQGKVNYTSEAAGWFDMSLVSRIDKKVADQLKFENRKSYQELIFEMAGLKFLAHPYWINLPVSAQITEKLTVGIENRVGNRWQGKRWWAYDIIADELRTAGFNIVFLKQQDTLQEYIEEINKCHFIITGDTLAMHLALACRVPTLAIFTCTSPWEIYDYGLLQKVVSPLLAESYYKTNPVPSAINAISVEMVKNNFLQLVEQVRTGKDISLDQDDAGNNAN